MKIIQQRLKPLNIQRTRLDYPQVDYVDQNGVQWIELNRGCKRQCIFCWADPNYKTFDTPKIVSNKVQIIGENILYDPKIKQKIIELGNLKVNNKVIYYGLGNGFDYRLINQEILKIAKKSRIGNINNKGNWQNGINIAWDLELNQEHKIKQILDHAKNVGYNIKLCKVFVLVNWKISYNDCMYKLNKIKEWGCKIDDCTWECTKKQFIPQYWDYPEYRKFRKQCRSHNISWSKNYDNIKNGGNKRK